MCDEEETPNIMLIIKEDLNLIHSWQIYIGKDTILWSYSILDQKIYYLLKTIKQPWDNPRLNVCRHR